NEGSLMSAVLAGALAPWIDLGCGLLPLAGFTLVVFFWVRSIGRRTDPTHICHILLVSKWILTLTYGAMTAVSMLAYWLTDVKERPPFSDLAYPVFVVGPVVFAGYYLVNAVLISAALNTALIQRYRDGNCVPTSADGTLIRRIVHRYYWLHAWLLAREPLSVTEVLDTVCPYHRDQ
ncbi:MAG: hypothetical protein JXO22_03250, partial [Phycisphaerae bacterium]|nr:hypothetical protein [Phycisphaerae bacterium]